MSGWWEGGEQGWGRAGFQPLTLSPNLPKPQIPRDSHTLPPDLDWGTLPPGTGVPSHL